MSVVSLLHSFFCLFCRTGKNPIRFFDRFMQIKKVLQGGVSSAVIVTSWRERQELSKPFIIGIILAPRMYSMIGWHHLYTCGKDPERYNQLFFISKKIGSVEIIVFHDVLGGFAPATAAAPLAISVENRFIMDL